MHESTPTAARSKLADITVAGLGLIVTDQIAIVEKHPAVDSKIFALDHSTQIGGPVPTALAQLQRLGISTRFLGAWGADLLGEAIESHLQNANIAFKPEQCRTATSTGFAHVWIESTTGRRTIVSSLPDGMPDPHEAERFGREADVLHLDGWGGEAAVLAARACAEQGGLVTLDAGSIKSATEQLLPFVRVLNAPMRFIKAYCGTEEVEKGAKALLSQGIELVTVTDGEKGAGVFTQEESVWFAAFQVQAIDTCGAGDVFCGGLIYAYLAGMTPPEALQFAMGTAAIKVSRRGNREALPTTQEIIAFLRNRNDI